jgi:hypothetical protein
MSIYQECNNQVHQLNRLFKQHDNLTYTYDIIQKYGVSVPLLDLIDHNNCLRLNLNNISILPSFNQEYHVAMEGLLDTIGAILKKLFGLIVDVIIKIIKGIFKIIATIFGLTEEAKFNKYQELKKQFEQQTQELISTVTVSTTSWANLFHPDSYREKLSRQYRDDSSDLSSKNKDIIERVKQEVHAFVDSHPVSDINTTALSKLQSWLDRYYDDFSKLYKTSSSIGYNPPRIEENLQNAKKLAKDLSIFLTDTAKILHPDEAIKMRDEFVSLGQPLIYKINEDLDNIKRNILPQLLTKSESELESTYQSIQNKNTQITNKLKSFQASMTKATIDPNQFTLKQLENSYGNIDKKSKANQQIKNFKSSLYGIEQLTKDIFSDKTQSTILTNYNKIISANDSSKASEAKTKLSQFYRVVRESILNTLHIFFKILYTIYIADMHTAKIFNIMSTIYSTNLQLFTPFLKDND